MVLKEELSEELKDELRDNDLLVFPEERNRNKYIVIYRKGRRRSL